MPVFRRLFLAMAIAAAAIPMRVAAAASPARPRLTIVISIDQFRADYLRRLSEFMLPPRQANGEVGGFRWLMAAGSEYGDCKYGHYPLFTGPGHAVIMSGAYPYKTGIVANDWWSKSSRRSIYCVDDPEMEVVGALPTSTATPMGPRNMRATTVGDELKLATAGASRTVSISLKDRAAILMGGHATDVCIWFDDEGGRWISSTAFCRTKQLPAWVAAMNYRQIPTAALGSEWRPSVPPAAALRATSPRLQHSEGPYGLGTAFPHRVGKAEDRRNYRAFTLIPAASKFVLDTAEAAIDAEKLGRRVGIPDLLTINLSTNDYVGHAFGPYSLEAIDTTIQTDRMLARFFAYVDRHVPGGLKQTLIVITADHGVAPLPEDAKELNIPSGRIDDRLVAQAAEDSLVAAYGAGPWLSRNAQGKGGYVETYLYLDDDRVDSALKSGRAASRSEIEATAARAAAKTPGVYNCYTRSQILEGRLPDTDLSKHLANGFHPRVSGDIIVVPDLYFIPGATPTPEYAASHGTPFAYDTLVPLLIAGPGIRHGWWSERVSPADIAPTVALLLGIQEPSGSDGRLLCSALSK